MKNKTLTQSQSFFSQLESVRRLVVALAFVILFSGAAFSVCVPVTDTTQFDFDHDCLADLAIYQPSGLWWIKYSGTTGNPAWCPPGVCIAPLGGGANDRIVPADYDGDGKTDVAVYHPNGDWEIVLSTSPTYTSLVKNWWSGTGTEIPQPADFTNPPDGKADLAYYLPGTGEWYVYDLTTGPMPVVIFGGLPGDKPVVGDYDGDHIADYAIVRPAAGTANWYLRRSSNNTIVVVTCGFSTDTLVPADYDGDDKTDFAIYRPSITTSASSEWYVCTSATGVLIYKQWGFVGDVPVPADYDGDNKADFAIYRPLDPLTFLIGRWWIDATSVPIPVTPWGGSTDAPIPNAFIH